MRQRRLVIGLVATVVLIAGCGGSDDDSDTPDDAAPATAGTSSDGDLSESEGDDAADGGGEAESEADDGGGDDSGSDGSGDGGSGVTGAVVVVGDEEFTFDQEIVCVGMGGAVGASFASSSADVSFDVDLPPGDWESRTDEGWEEPSVRLDDDRLDAPVSWRAGGDVVDEIVGVPPEVTVTSFSVDGTSGSGTATVVDIYGIGVDELVVAEMTFEFSCN